MMLFLHAKLAEEQRMREEFARVHVCRRFAMELRVRAQPGPAALNPDTAPAR